MTDYIPVEHGALRNVVLGVSVSIDKTGAARGFGSAQVGDIVRRVSERVLALDGHLAFGHDWRPGGVMEDVLNIALERRTVGDISGQGGNGLSEEENRLLFHANSLHAVVQLVVRGLVRLSREDAAGTS